MQHCFVPQQLTIKVKIKRFYTTPKVSFTRPSPRLSQVDQILIFCNSFLDWKTFRKFLSVHLVCCSLHNSANSQQKFKLRDFEGEIISICLAYAYAFLNMNNILVKTGGCQVNVSPTVLSRKHFMRFLKL